MIGLQEFSKAAHKPRIVNKHKELRAMNCQPTNQTILTVMIAAGLILSTLSFSTNALAQIPDEFTNLKVLDEKIKKGKLVGIMKSWTRALGVRCNYCHVGGSAQSLDGMEFDKDDKQSKKTTRLMLEMVNNINREFVSKVEGTSNTGMEVSCITCHRGQIHPRQIEEVLLKSHADGGFKAAATVYDSLRAKYYGSHTFDFSIKALTRIAQDLSRSGDMEDALKFLKLNQKYNPESVWNYLMMGRLYMQSGDKESAAVSFEKVLELEPENRLGKQMLDQIKKE